MNWSKSTEHQNFKTPVPCILQISTTFNLYSGRPKMGLSVNNTQKITQAMVEIQTGGDNHPPPPPPPHTHTHFGQIC